MPAERRAPSRAAASSPPSPETLAASVAALIVAIEGQPEGAPAAGAYRAALRRKGHDLAAGGGAPALADVLARVRAPVPERADARAAILDAVWAGLPGWRD